MISTNKYKNVSDEKEFINPLNSIDILAEKLGKDTNDINELYNQIGNNLRKKNIPEYKINDKTLRRIQAYLKACLLKETSPEELEKINLLTDEHERRTLEEESLEKDDEDVYYSNLSSQQLDIYEFKESTIPNYFQYDVFKWKDKIYMKISSNPHSFFVLDQENKIIQTLNISKKTNKDGDEKYTEIKQQILARFSVDEICEYRQLTPELSPQYSMIINKKNNRKTKIGHGNLDEIIGQLKGIGGVFRKLNSASDTINDLIALAEESGMLIEKKDPPFPGFFYIDKQLITTINFDYPSATELREAIMLLHEFSDHFKEFYDNLAYCLHWQILAPFSFAKKQIGSSDKLGSLYLYGQSRTGKTIIGFLVSHIWNRDDCFVGAGSIHSEASYGRNISQHTFPVVLDEGARVFTDTKTNLPDIFKNSVFYPVVRGRYSPFTHRYEDIPSLSAPIITSNYNEPQSAALGARLKSLEFLRTKPRTSNEIKEFTEKFDPENRTGPLKKLSFIGCYVANYMIDNQELIKKPWEQVSKEIWQSMYEYSSLSTPSWMKEYKTASGLQESWEAEDNEKYTMFRNLVLRNADPYIPAENEKPISVYDKIHDVVMNSRETWIESKEMSRGPNKGKMVVEIDSGICKDIMIKFNMEISFKMLINDLEGKIVVTKRNNKSIKVARWLYEDFIKLLGGTLPKEMLEKED